MPTYNRRDLIGESIRSVIDQTHERWELIVVDDGSTDDTTKVVQAFADDRIKYYCHEHSGKFGVARNRGITIAKGDLIAFLDSDDLWEPQKLATQVQVLHDHPQTGFVFSNVHLFGNTQHQSPDLVDLINTNLFFNIWKEDGIVFYPSTLMFRKSVLIKTKFLDEQTQHGADLDFLFALSESFAGHFLSKRLVHIRKHASNTSTSDIVFGYDDSIAHAERYYRKGSLPSKMYRQLMATYYYRKGMVYRKHGEHKKAGVCFSTCLKFNPMEVKAIIRLMQSMI